MRLILNLSEEALQALHMPVNGSGGFQSLLRGLQANIHGDELTLTVEQVQRIVAYARRHGQGGFQGRLSTVIESINELLTALGAGTI